MTEGTQEAIVGALAVAVLVGLVGAFVAGVHRGTRRGVAVAGCSVFVGVGGVGATFASGEDRWTAASIVCEAAVGALCALFSADEDWDNDEG